MNQPERTRRKMHIAVWSSGPPTHERQCSICGARKQSYRGRRLGLERWVLNGQPMQWCPGKEKL